MKRFYFIALSLCLLAVPFGLNFQTAAQNEVSQTAESNLISPNIVVSQLYGGGGSGNAQFTNDFVELFNRGSQPVSLNGWSVQYASATGTNWLVTPLSNFTLQPGQYYLIQYASSGASGGALPTPNLIAPPVTVGTNTFIPNLSGTTGKLALVNSAAQLPASNCPLTDPTIVDFVGYGASASCFETNRTPDLNIVTAGIRIGGGCVDTDDNNANFTIAAPAPRNSSSPLNVCTGSGNTLAANGSANPNTVSPGGTTTFLVRVFPADTPPSSGITVTGNLTNVGGSAAQIFYDDGTNGDVTPGDNIFSFRYTIPADVAGGQRNIPVVAADAQGRTANAIISLTVNAPLPNDDPLLLGNPSGATNDVANENNYLMVKPQYTIAYNRSRATANWVAWRLDLSWLGTAPRQDDFRPDPALPVGWYQVTDTDYSGSGYDRGHMSPSGDRTRSIPDNSATFLMTNMVPQTAANNQGAWEDFESYCRTQAQIGQEIYIVSGVVGNIGTVAQGRVVVPQYTWKVALFLPNGTNDLQRVTKGTRAVGIIVPNFPPLDINAVWRQFRVSVNEVENLTGYNFFSNVPKITQEIIERRKDRL
ncbi:MAG: DNA/RNA non-specific endonuclease [Pyrinomonadaceae bacterium]|nr:DNA/RNA non-specific endonuclease [Pyrinomonadaceae bacterium]